MTERDHRQGHTADATLNVCSIQHMVNVCVFNAPNGNKTPSAARDPGMTAA